MRVVLITQDDPFYLSNVLDEFFVHLNDDVSCRHAIISEASPFGKKSSFLKKARKTYKIFGVHFFIHYTLRFVFAKIRGKSITGVLKRRNVREIRLKTSINHVTSIELIKNLKPDLLVSILGNEIYKAELLNIAPCLNLHTAALPRYRGLMPTFWALKNGEKEIGVSIFWVNEGIDSGDLVEQDIIDISHKPSQAELIKQTKSIGVRLMAEAVNKFMSGELESWDNNDEYSSYFGFPTREDVLDFIKSDNRFY